MATKTVRVSDLTGEVIQNDSDLVTIVVYEHPALEVPVSLDATKDEVKSLEGTGKDFVVIGLLSEGGDKQEKLVLELDKFERLIQGDPQEVLEAAPVYGFDSGRHEPEPEPTPRRRGRPRGRGSAPAPRAKGVDYKTPQNAGLIHRGRITEEEKALVQQDLERANANRRREGQPEIDLNNLKDVEKYGLQRHAEKKGVNL